jgi:methylase of polypeptide subunit release factors
MPCSSSLSNRYDLIISNPPYIPTTDENTITNDVLQYESYTALFSGVDGMDMIRTIIHQLPYWGKVGTVCWLEVNPTHPPLIKQLLHFDSNNNTKGQWNRKEDSITNKHVIDNPVGFVEYVADYRDMFGHDRFVQLRVMKTKEAR